MYKQKISVSSTRHCKTVVRAFKCAVEHVFIEALQIRSCGTTNWLYSINGALLPCKYISFRAFKIIWLTVCALALVVSSFPSRTWWPLLSGLSKEKWLEMY